MTQKLNCLNCETTENVTMHPSYTAYHWDGKGDDPNRDVLLCDVCGEEHTEYWAEMWSYARGGW